MTLYDRVKGGSPVDQGEVDAIVAFVSDEPYQLDARGVKYEVIQLAGSLPGVGSGNLFSSEAFARENPLATRAFVQASQLGWSYALDHPEEIVDLILRDYSVDSSREALLFEAGVIRQLMMPVEEPKSEPIGFHTAKKKAPKIRKNTKDQGK